MKDRPGGQDDCFGLGIFGEEKKIKKTEGRLAFWVRYIGGYRRSIQV